MPQENNSNIELRSEAIQEILGKPPHAIIRWGISVILAVVLLIFIGSSLFKYPDIVTSEVVITTKNPPSWVVARSTGKLQQLYINDKELVKTGQVLALIESPASADDIFRMKAELDKLEPFFTSSYSTTLLTQLPDCSLQLGELQSAYVNLKKLLNDYDRFIALDHYTIQKKSLERELAEQKTLVEHYKRQHQLQAEDERLAEKQFSRQKDLYASKTISEVEFENAEKQLLATRKATEQAKLTLTNAQIAVEKQTQSIVDLAITYEDKLKDTQGNLYNTYEQLKAQVSIWEQQYVLKAQADGTLSFNNVWSVNQQVNAGEKLFVVVPEEQGELIGKVSLVAEGAGKVKVGQQVNIKLDGYPYMEYGMIRGVVTSISLVPSEKKYSLEVALPNGLLSFYNKSVDFTGELTGVAEIRTDEYSVLERFLHPIMHLLHQ